MLISKRKCTKCKINKPFQDFHLARKEKYGISCQCKICKKKYRKSYYDLNKNFELERNKKYHRKNPSKGLLYHARIRARKSNLKFGLLLEDIKIPKKCPILGIPIKVSDNYMNRSSPSIDRINNKKGYTKDNIIIISWRANCLKRDSTQKERRRLADFYERFTE